MLWEPVVPALEVPFQIFFVPSGEGREPRKHLVEYGAERPDVDLVVIALTFQDLWRHIQWRTTHRLGQILLRLKLLRKSQISDRDIDISDQRRRLFELFELLSTSENFILT